MTDEAQPLDRRAVVEALVAGRAVRRRQEADRLVVADGLDLAAGSLGDPADGQARYVDCPLKLQLL
jgi:hypothetical protein